MIIHGTATSNSPTTLAKDAYDLKSLEHILAGAYPIEKDMISELEGFNAVFEKYKLQYSNHN